MMFVLNINAMAWYMYELIPISRLQASFVQPLHLLLTIKLYLFLQT